MKPFLMWYTYCIGVCKWPQPLDSYLGGRQQIHQTKSIYYEKCQVTISYSTKCVTSSSAQRSCDLFWTSQTSLVKAEDAG